MKKEKNKQIDLQQSIKKLGRYFNSIICKKK